MPLIIFCKNMQDYQVVSFQESVSIGRDQNNEIVLNSRGVSREHAIVVKQGNAFHLIDQGSKNAIWLGNEIIKEHILTHGLTFRIADYLLTFVDNHPNEAQAKVCYQEDSTGTAAIQDCGHETMLMTDFKIESDFQVLHEISQADIKERIATIVAKGQKLAASCDDDGLMKNILSLALFATDAKRGFIAIKDKQGDLVYRKTENFSPATDNKNVNHTAIDKVLKNGRSVSCQSCLSNGTGTVIDNAFICTPLFCEESIVGCCYIIRGQNIGFTEIEILLLELVMMLGSSYPRGRSTPQTSKPRISDEREKGASSKNVVIKSSNMVRLYEDVRTMSPINVPLLILGEPGTGKELVASALHRFSKRKGPYLTLNCSAIPEGIFESELFGSVKGAYHNATDRPGKLEIAHQGTLFLDEIGDMAISLQPKLLRFLENQELTRLGDNTVKKLDVRIVAATNQDLQSMINDKLFRPDLYQRLSCFCLKIPPLRDRVDDIEPLVNHFLQEFSEEYGWQVSRVSAKAMDLLKRFTWPGNVRELRNTVLRLAVQAQGSLITPEDLKQLIDGIGDIKRQVVASFPSLEEKEKEHIHEALQYSGWNISEASKMLGIARSTFYKKITKYNIAAEKH